MMTAFSTLPGEAVYEQFFDAGNDPPTWTAASRCFSRG
jgi:hypothetical protein